MSRDDDLRALDPARSVVVEACAGSGKTWTLVSRLIRLLLAGAQPGDILAITYTRKAAREIEERLQHWLAELAVVDDERVSAFLAERGLDAQRDPTLIARARALFEQVADARPGLTVNTFHGWFSSLLGAAPLNSGLRGLQLSERTAQLRDQAWAALMRRAGRAPQSELALALRSLLGQCGVAGTKTLAGALVDRRAEWEAWLAAHGGLAGVFAHLESFFGADRPAPEVVLSADAVFRRDASELARILGQGGKKLQQMATTLEQTLSCDEPPEFFERARAALLTGKNEPRACTVDKTLAATGQGERALALFDGCSAAVLRALGALSDRAAWELNRHALTVASAMLDAYDRIKQNAGVLDFGDLEWHAARLLSDAQTGPFVQARLDARYRHLLLDEFQDTNPLQWQVLMHWLDAYAPGQVQPVVFVVGDPKQSIYRFRRADPRIFTHAATVFEQRFGALRLQRNETRRSSPAVVSVVNAVFGDMDVFEGFAPHSTTRTDLPGRVEVLPAFGHGAAAEPAAADSPTVASGLRNPLRQPRLAIEDSRRKREADALCARLKQMVGQLAVRDAHSGATRAARYGDMMILLRRRTGLAVYEAALRAHGIPYFGASRGRLLDTLEASDLLALLRFLAAPADALSLAHVLRSPLFAFDDAQLLDLTGDGAASLWPTLRARRADSDPAHARAAALLEGWLDAATRLPVHDLLDRVFDQGALMPRYAASIDAMAWPGVRANLEAFIELALKVDSGRYPSLPRFIDELTRLRNEDDEAPDEGLILGEDPSRGRVRVLTIHAAKGLEAPIVWLADAVARQRTDSGARVLLAWPPGEAAPGHLSLLQKKDNQGHARAAFIEAEARAAAREDANLLYVALTRARQVLYVSGVSPAKGSSAGSWLDRVTAALGGCVDAVPTDGGGMRLVHGVLADCVDDTPDDPVVRVVVTDAPILPAIGERRALVTLDPVQLWGVGLHSWLEALAGGEPSPARPAGLDVEQWRDLEAIARRLVASDVLQRFFDPAQHRWSANELEFVLPDGQPGRIDRLVEFEDDIWILDYKSGQGDRFAESYTAQLAGYAEAVAAIRPGKVVHAALIRPDGALDVRF
ncbi:exodeoxyribonuclease V subunit beta [Methyloversatilis sp. XJ19-49]|uniref:UvrD-helicase domain-containing protein n=1 Tax=Methyloversatilis sp. XJ19-49 TaxID=2963429 RepID=UPI00211BC27C|nr:UvrD-helicase domain-containing protein [Methyloversatilis sp. XJ19-49]MCQ9378411.1 UvrD-helicase domain-containing protein [Methyloversatilis sp. XJ19-49]